MNKVILIGRLAADPELKKTAGGLSVCTFRLAITRRYTDAQGQRQADFVPVIAWRELGENCHKYLSKGKHAAVVGEIQTRSYDAQDGSKRYVTEVIASEVEFLTPKNAQSGAATAANGTPDGYEEIEDDELPF